MVAQAQDTTSCKGDAQGVRKPVLGPDSVSGQAGALQCGAELRAADGSSL